MMSKKNIMTKASFRNHLKSNNRTQDMKSKADSLGLPARHTDYVTTNIMALLINSVISLAHIDLSQSEWCDTKIASGTCAVSLPTRAYSVDTSFEIEQGVIRLQG